MKKLFPLHVSGKDDARVLDAIKHDVRKYVKRERRKTPPEGFNAWRFDCKAGADSASATTCGVKEISGVIESIANNGGAEVYIEIIAAPDQRRPGDAPEAGS